MISPDVPSNNPNRIVDFESRIVELGLFDFAFYAEFYPDVIRAGYEPLDHYLRFGAAEGRRPSIGFDPFDYCAKCPEPVAVRDALEHYVKTHAGDGYLRPRIRFNSLDLKQARHLIEKSGFFDGDFYLNRNPPVRQRGVDPILHYLIDGARLFHDPSERFSAAAYYVLFPRVFEDKLNPLLHYLMNGAEIQEPPPNLRKVRGRKTSNEQRLRDRDTTLERLAGLSFFTRFDFTLDSNGPTEWVSECVDFLSKQEPTLKLGRAKPDVSIVIPVYGQMPFLLSCLDSLSRHTSRYSVEIIVADDASPDEARVNLVSKLPWVTYFRREQNGGFLECCNSAVQQAAGRYVVLLNSDTRVVENWLVWRELGGFDTFFRPAYCEDVDLAFRIRHSGREVWYQPLSRVIHYEGATHGKDEKVGVKSHQVVNLKRLKERWAGKTPGTRAGGELPDLEANRCRQRMLVVDADVHRPDRDAGSVVASQIMAAFRHQGFSQTFLSLHNPSFDPVYTAGYQRLGVKVLYRPWFQHLRDALEQSEDFDYVLVFRYGIVQEIVADVRSRLPLACILFSNVDLHYLRTEREAELTSDRSLRILASRMKTDELAVFSQVDCSIVHTEIEKNAVMGSNWDQRDNIVVLPWIINTTAPVAPLAQRHDIMFLGGFRHQPNIDAVVFFLNEVWPHLRRRIDCDLRFIIVGADAPEKIKSLASDRVIVTGYVPDVTPYFEQARAFVAPLRFGAGIKGKVIQSLAHGVPVVATGVASEGIGLQDGIHYLLADGPDAIVDRLADVLCNLELAESLQKAGLAFIEDNFSFGNAVRLCSRSLDEADATWLRREEDRRASILSGNSGQR